jgi:cytoskeletal protein CcmA (bactofilin family)
MFGKKANGAKSGKQVWNAFFAKSVEIEGSLRFTGLLNIDGALTGAIVAKGMLVTGVAALITGDVFVENLILSGEVVGNIYSTGEVHLNATAKVRGNINYHTLSVVPGAVLEGNSHQFSESEREELTARIQAELGGDKETSAARGEVEIKTSLGDGGGDNNNKREGRKARDKNAERRSADERPSPQLAVMDENGPWEEKAS